MSARRLSGRASADRCYNSLVSSTHTRPSHPSTASHDRPVARSPVALLPTHSTPSPPPLVRHLAGGQPQQRGTTLAVSQRQRQPARRTPDEAAAAPAGAAAPAAGQPNGMSAAPQRCVAVPPAAGHYLLADAHVPTGCVHGALPPGLAVDVDNLARLDIEVRLGLPIASPLSPLSFLGGGCMAATAGAAPQAVPRCCPLRPPYLLLTLWPLGAAGAGWQGGSAVPGRRGRRGSHLPRGRPARQDGAAHVCRPAHPHRCAHAAAAALLSRVAGVCC